MDQLTKMLGEAGESTSETLSLCVTPSFRNKFSRLMQILEEKNLKRSGLKRIKSALERELDEILKMAEGEKAS